MADRDRDLVEEMALWLLRCFLVVWPLSVCAASGSGEVLPLTAAQVQALGIETAPVTPQRSAELHSLPAQVVVPNSQMHVVSAPLAALVESMSVAVNDSVVKGRVLARLQSPALAEIQRGYLQAATRLALAESNKNRDDQLLKEGIIAESRLRSSRSQYIEAVAEFDERRQALRLGGMSEAAIEKLRRSRVVSSTLEVASPADGVVVEQLASPGQRVDTAAPIFKIAELDPLWLEIEVPATQVSAAQPGAAVSVPAYGITARVISTARTVAANQTVMVRAEVKGAAHILRPGQMVEAAMATAPSSAAQWRVPNEAVVRHQGRLLVFLATSSGFRAQEVALVSESPLFSVVTGPFSPEDRIAVRGIAALKARLAGIGNP